MQAQGFVVYVDDAPIEFTSGQLTGNDLMAKVGTDQLVILLEDGTQRQVGSDEVFDLEQSHRFKRPPHFKRG